MSDWIRKMAKRSEVLMSVCLGAYHLAEAGVLSGEKVTTMNGANADIRISKYATAPARTTGNSTRKGRSSRAIGNNLVRPRHSCSSASKK